MLNPNLDSVIFSESMHKRYARHLTLPHIGLEGQKRLSKAKVLCVGLGGLGSACLLYLVAAGVNNIGIVDNDTVDISNLQRQIVYKSIDIGYHKVKCIRKSLLDINTKCSIQSYNKTLDADNAVQIIPQYDIVIDGTDSFQSKQIISNACYSFNKLHIYGAVSEFEGQVSVFNYQGGPQYQDLHLQNMLKNINQDCSTNGILGILTGIIGILQATEVIKIITGINNILSGSVLVYNALNSSFRKIRLRKHFSSNQIHKPCQYIYNKFSPKSYINFDFIDNPSYIIKDSLTEKNQILLIDIRKPCEYDFNHVKGSINIPLRTLRHKKILSFLANQSHINNIYIYCNTVSRSRTAVSLLSKHGIMSYRFSHKL